MSCWHGSPELGNLFASTRNHPCTPLPVGARVSSTGALGGHRAPTVPASVYMPPLPGNYNAALRGSLKAANVLLCVGCALRGREALRTSLVWGKEGHPCGMKPAGHEPSEKTSSPLQGPLLLMFGFVSSSTVSIYFPCKDSNDGFTRSSRRRKMIKPCGLAVL